MTHLYRLCAFAPAPGVLRWTCQRCPRVVQQDLRTGAITVQVAGLESVDHAGRSGAHHVFDRPELGAFEAGGKMAAFLEGL